MNSLRHSPLAAAELPSASLAPPPLPPLRLAVVLSHPTQYYSPWFRWLAAETALDFRVFYLWDFGVSPRRDQQFGLTLKWDVDLLSGYAHEFVPNRARHPGPHHLRGLRNPGLAARLAAWGPEALLLFGYKSISQLGVIAWARRRRLPLIFRGDSHFLGRPAPARRRRLPLRWLYGQFAALTYVGAANRGYFEHLGVSPQRLFFAPHSVDHHLFDPTNAGYRSAAAALRTQLGLAGETRIVLFAGKFIPAKQAAELLQAFLDLAPRQAALVLVGDGEERPRLQAMARRAPAGAVHFLPFANQSEMPARYLMSDLLALPSRGCYETWGLAVNESMQMGRPALVSDRVGCQQDLVTDGETGWVFSIDQPGGLELKLAQALAALADPAAVARMRRKVAERIARYGFEQTTSGLLAALASLR